MRLVESIPQIMDIVSIHPVAPWPTVIGSVNQSVFKNISLIILPKWSNDLSSCNKTWVKSVSVGYFVDILGNYFNCSCFEQWSV